MVLRDVYSPPVFPTLQLSLIYQNLLISSLWGYCACTSFKKLCATANIFIVITCSVDGCGRRHGRNGESISNSGVHIGKCKTCIKKIIKANQIPIATSTAPTTPAPPTAEPPSLGPLVFRHALLTSPTAPRTRASAAAVIHAAIATKGVDKTDDSHSSLNRLQSSRNNFARDPLSQPLTPLSLGGASSFTPSSVLGQCLTMTSESVSVEGEESATFISVSPPPSVSIPELVVDTSHVSGIIDGPNAKAITCLANGIELDDDSIILDGALLKSLFPMHPIFEPHNTNNLLVLKKCTVCDDRFVKTKSDRTR